MLKILICDDNVSVSNKVYSLIDEIKKEKNLNFDIDVRENGNFILSEKVKYDIALIDIEMPGINGLHLAKVLKSYNPDVIIIILTSYNYYLDNAMKIQVFRFLSKPIDNNRFNINFIEALEYYKQISKQIIIEKSDKVYTVKTKDILYIENLKHGSKIVTKNNMFVTSKKPMEWYNTINLPNIFVFSHKSYLVNLQNIISFSRSFIEFGVTENKSIKIPCISQRKYAFFRKAFFDFMTDNR